MVTLPEKTWKLFKEGGVFVPSPLALDASGQCLEDYQRLLTLYYIRSGARSVIPGAHTGEFALNRMEVFSYWLKLVKEMTLRYGKDMLLMAAVGGDKCREQAELAARLDYDIVMVAPTAFAGKKPAEVIGLLTDIASIIPTFGFELQRAIPGSYTFSPNLWSDIFAISYGAKGASFDTYRSLLMLEAAARSQRKEQLLMLTGNDDRIVSDLLGQFAFFDDTGAKEIEYKGGLLGHFATDTRAVVQWVQMIRKYKVTGIWDFPMTREALIHAVNHCNMVLFDAIGNFENSVWGVKYRLSSLGLLPGPFCATERGREGQAEAIDKVYGDYPLLTDDLFLQEQLENLKKEIGIKI
ncbi:MAG: hypothetical protein JJU28_05565 [Cyclobacteriaceae bacterium]|nr:hypothetical protein [Cyclobacteriaceae bacterium]